MKKAFGQTVRDLKREVNKKVLKVPGIEQKILDSTSNEPWGPHGSHLSDIAQATRNYHEYQIIMTVIWKRINDTGKNWRHVYKALTVLDYLVAYGSERVIDEIREHAYQISTLADFQYIDSSGRDQGINVRRKSQSLVALVNDKERIQEVRQKALANRDKYQSTSSTGGSRPNSYGGYGDDNHFEGRYGYKDDDRNGHEKERDGGYRDDNRYGRGGDSYSRDGDRYGRDYDERNERDSYRDDEYRGRGNDDYRLGPRKSVDRDPNRSIYDNDSARSGGGGKTDDHSQDDRRLVGQLSERNNSAPPSYEEVIRDAQNNIQNERDGGTVASPTYKSTSPPAPKETSPSKTISQNQNHFAFGESAATTNQEVDAFDEFDPRGFVSAPKPAANSLELDFFGSLSASDSTNSLALMPAPSAATNFNADVPTYPDFGTDAVAPSMAASMLSQPNENPFGDAPFKATPQEYFQAHQSQNFAPVGSVQSASGSIQSAEAIPLAASEVQTVTSFDFGDTLGGLTYTPNFEDGYSAANPAFLGSEFTESIASSDGQGYQGSAALISSQTAQPAAPTGFPTTQMNHHPLTIPSATHPSQDTMQSAQLNFQQQGVPTPPFFPSLEAPLSSQAAQPAAAYSTQSAHLNLQQQQQSTAFPPARFPSLAAPISSQASQPAAPNSMQTDHFNLLQQTGIPGSLATQAAPATSAGLAVQIQPPKGKFEPKSTVWADTLSRGLVNLNISGSKINPLADIGIDFESINRKEKRNEVRTSATPVTSTITMGKAMGAGSGVGRSGAGVLGAPPNPMISSGIVGYGGNMNQPMGMGGYGGSMNQAPMGMVMGMNMGMGMGMGMGMNMGMGQRAPMQPSSGIVPPGHAMPGIGYNPMMGTGNYGSQQPPGGGAQQPYGGGYR